jgi:hypothetical protein
MSMATVDMDLALHSFTRTDPEAFIPANIGEQSSWTKPSQEDEPSENATTQHDRPRELGEKLKALFNVGRQQAFEDGMESEFSRGLIALIKYYGDSTLVELIGILRNERVSEEALSEALRWIGRMNHPPTYESRRWALQHSLFHPSARVRDGAVLGVAFLDDTRAIPDLKRAIRGEPIRELREDMEQVLAQLESL